ncbi:protein nucleotidyltransferase YdiU-like [Babylonia areolata]|uniref:protein nucleotidyltransferase YdiU-like n=1 Tax=Babylonia areolata TaxID=304850 RepID=UPI003FD12B7C
MLSHFALILWFLFLPYAGSVEVNRVLHKCLLSYPEFRSTMLCRFFPIHIDCDDHTKWIPCVCPSFLSPPEQVNFMFTPIVTKIRELETDFKSWKFPTDHRLFTTFPIDTHTENSVRQVKRAVFSQVHPVPFQSGATLASVSHEALSEILDLSPSVSSSEEFLRFVSGDLRVVSAVPLSHRYGGHQFGQWAGQLGDGRAVLLGEYVNRKGERWELQLKGSGLTPYSRQGDGRAVIRSSVREFLCSEAMHHLGIPTSRAASLVVSEDTVVRDQFYDGHPRPERTAVVLRLARSWFRIGSLEILTHSGEVDLLKEVVDFTIAEHFPDIDPTDSGKYLAFFQEVVRDTARLMALWQSVGFAHGVCNTDNFSLLSITIDYGPFGFLDAYDPRFVPNTSDDEHRYSYENQPSVGAFNLEKLRLALLPLWTENDKAVSKKILHGYAEYYKSRFMELFRRKLGLETSSGEEDENLVAVLLKMMADTKADFTMTFRELGEVSLPELTQGHFGKWALRTLMSHEWYSGWVAMYAARLKSEWQTDQGRQRMMNSSNPRYILRNWVAQLAVDSVERNDFSVVNKLLDIVKNPFTYQQTAEDMGLAARPPDWASGLKVSCSS